MTFKPDKIFIGKSPLNSMTEFSGGHGPEFDGNSILLQMANNEYIYIGSEIAAFDALNKIKEYVSPVGNNDVPYPYAIDEQNNIYLLTENAIIKNNNETADKLKKYDDPYQYYYDKHVIAEVKGNKSDRASIKNFGNVNEFYIGDKPYTLTYVPDPAKNYDRIRSSFKSPMYIIDKNNNKKELTKKEYVQLMELYGAKQNFIPFRFKTVYSDRDINGTLLGYYVATVQSLKK